MRRSPALGVGQPKIRNATSDLRSNLGSGLSKGSHNIAQSRKPSVFGSLSNRNIALQDGQQRTQGQRKNAIQVLDENGMDVTPRSLLSDTSSLRKHQSSTIMNAGDSSSVGTPSEFMSQSMFGASTTQNSYAQGFSRSLMGSMIGSASKISLDSITDEIAEPSHMHDFGGGLGDIRTRRTAPKEDLTESDLDKMISITLEETETIWHLDIPGTAVASDTERAIEAKQRNEKYEQLLRNKVGNDMYIAKGVQTFNDALKHKDAQTLPIRREDVGCLATTWDMYDTYNADQSPKENAEESVESLSRPGTPTKTSEPPIAALPTVGEKDEKGTFRKGSMMSTITESHASFTTTSETLDMFEFVETASQHQLQLEQQTEKILQSDALKKSLFIMERAVMQNIYHARQAMYRGLTPAITHEEKDDLTENVETQQNLGPFLNKLWTYSCTLTRGMSVFCMCWNKANSDILAVGYGDLEGTSGKQGLLCCWSLKNPEQPERIYTLDSPVTAIDFSISHPNLVAAGLHNGTIAVFNVRKQSDKQILDSFGHPGKHSGPIWQLRWVERDKGTGEEKGEALVTSSADGRVTQWSIRKGFEYQDLMKLKRLIATKNPLGKQQKSETTKKGDAVISRYSSGFSFDFHVTDGLVYVAGTEEGFIHKCSCSYNEQFLETYSGHTGPVYKVLWNSVYPSAFLSCSSDWTLRLWDQNKQQSMLTMQSSPNAILDADWCPFSGTVFVAITDSQIQVWDLTHSVLDPLLVQNSVHLAKLSSVLFARNSECILVGDCDGQVTAYQMCSIPPSTDQIETLKKILMGREEVLRREENTGKGDNEAKKDEREDDLVDR